MAVAAAVVAGGAIAASTVAGVISAGEKKDVAGQRFDHAFAAADEGHKAAKRAEEKALPSPQELAALEKSMKSAELTLEREQKLIEAVDPAIMEAGKQAYQMLQGKESEMLGPLRRQRERQKQQMKETLRRQLGPGFETSSAGIEALSKFDMDTSDLLANTQQKAVMDFLGVSQNAAQLGRQTEAGARGQLNQTGALFGNIQERQMNAAMNTGRQLIAGGQLIDQAMAGKQSAAGGEADALGQGFGQVAKFAGFAANGGFGGRTADPTTQKTGSGNYGRGGLQEM